MFIITNTALLGRTDTSLESATWTSSDSQLVQLEKEIVRRIQEEPSSPRMHYLLSRVYLRMSFVYPDRLYLASQAIGLAQQAIDLAPDLEDGYLAMLQILGQGLDPSASQELLKRLESGVKTSWRTELTRILLSKQQNVFGEKDFDRLHALYIKAQEAREILAVVVTGEIFALGPEQQITIIKRLAAVEDHPYLAIALSRAYQDKDQTNLARHVIARARKKWPEHPLLQVRDALFSAQSKERPARAVKKLKSALTLGHLAREVRAELNYHLGASQLRRGKSVLSWPYFLSYLRLSYGLDEAYERVMDLLRSQTDLGQQLGWTDQAIKSFPGQVAFYRSKGHMLSTKLGEHSKALEALGAARSIAPFDIATLYELGFTFYRMQDYRRALTSFEEVSELVPDDATALYNQACMHALMGSADQALSELEVALKLDPSLQKVAKDDSDFVALRDHPDFRHLIHSQLKPQIWPLGSDSDVPGEWLGPEERQGRLN